MSKYAEFHKELHFSDEKAERCREEIQPRRRAGYRVCGFRFCFAAARIRTTPITAFNFVSKKTIFLLHFVREWCTITS